MAEFRLAVGEGRRALGGELDLPVSVYDLEALKNSRYPILEGIRPVWMQLSHTAAMTMQHISVVWKGFLMGKNWFALYQKKNTVMISTQMTGSHTNLRLLEMRHL